MTKQSNISEILEMVRMTAPGTRLREGLDNVLRANTGGLIIVGDYDKVSALAEGGFHINAPYTPAHLYELAKMDGAILLSKDCTKIFSANCHLNPDPGTPSSETGIRHRTAEQTARQTGELVISISQRRQLITLYRGSQRYVLRESASLLNTATQAIEALEKYKNALDEAFVRLSLEEFDDMVSLADVVQVVQRAEMLKRVDNELTLYIAELGTEGRLVSMQAEELMSNVDLDERMALRDYLVFDDESPEADQVSTALDKLGRLSSEDLLDGDRLAGILGYTGYSDKERRNQLYSRGYRMLHKIPRLPSSIIDNVVETFLNLNRITKASIDDLDEVEGIGPARAQQISTGLDRLRTQTIMDSHWF
ncbi:DNA integrity scanning diadenylate cyclase DisA [Peptococcus simiae]|uniref:DNA integrity scanning diadenylate cyclase DisA n=1 Tax=Peptococcus simiae TaxID=1643805 RepID=UPI0039804622